MIRFIAFSRNVISLAETFPSDSVDFALAIVARPPREVSLDAGGVPPRRRISFVNLFDKRFTRPARVCVPWVIDFNWGCLCISRPQGRKGG
jgi:hypothetical protein